MMESTMTVALKSQLKLKGTIAGAVYTFRSQQHDIFMGRDVDRAAWPNGPGHEVRHRKVMALGESQLSRLSGGGTGAQEGIEVVKGDLDDEATLRRWCIIESGFKPPCREVADALIGYRKVKDIRLAEGLPPVRCVTFTTQYSANASSG